MGRAVQTKIRADAEDGRHEESIQGQDDRLRLALAAGGIGTWDWDLASGRITWDGRMHELYGLAPGSFSGRHADLLERLHPEDRGVLAEQLMRIGEARSTEAREVEFRILLPDGGERYLADRSEVLLDAEGRIERMIGVTWDITARKQAERALAQAHQQMEAAHARVKQDLEAAARVQQALLPVSPATLDGVSVAWRYEPCEELGGDALNLSVVGGRYLVAYVLDVCGHGVPSSLLAVSVTHRLNRGGGLIEEHSVPRAGGRPQPPATVARHLNRLFPMSDGSGLYFTLLYGVLDGYSGEFRYVSAGNQGPILLRGGRASIHDKPALPIGVVADAEYEEGVLHLEPGDRLYLATDGVSEERNREREPFSRERLCGVLEAQARGTLDASLDAVLQGVADWRCSREASDDVAMVGLELEARGDV